MIKITNTVKHLVILNVILFVAKLIFSSKGISLDLYLALFFPEGELFKPWQVITHMFMHADETHILFNMLALWMFGSAVENLLGKNKFLILYFFAGFGSMVLHLSSMYFQYFDLISLLSDADIAEIKSTGAAISMEGKNWVDPTLAKINLILHSPMLGASGAIMGILVAFGLLLPNAELMMLFLPIPIKAKYFIPIIIAIDLIGGITGYSILSPSNVAHWAHIGGALTGFLVMFFWKKKYSI